MLLLQNKFMEEITDKYNFVIQIDDDPFVTSKHRMIIEKKNLGNFFQTISRAEKALEELTNLSQNGRGLPRYIILDLNMPNMNGLEFLVEFQKKFQIENVKTRIIIASSNTSDLQRTKVKNNPYVIAYIEKPIPVNYIENLIIDHNG